MVCVRKKFTVPFPIRRIPTDALGVGTQTSGYTNITRAWTNVGCETQSVRGKSRDDNNDYYRYSRYTNDRIRIIEYICPRNIRVMFANT